MKRNSRHTQRNSAAVALILATTIAVLALNPAPAYADGMAVLLAEVPLYSQLDNVGVEWTSCGPTSLAMALNYRGAGTTPRAVVYYATTHNGQDGKRLYLPHDPAKVFTSPQHLYEIAQHYGDPVQGWATDSESAQATLREFLADGLPVIVDVTVPIARNGSTAAHFVIVTGIDADSTVYVNDPYGEGRGGQRRTVAWEDFFWAWQNNGDGHVGGHGWWMVAEAPRKRPPQAPEMPTIDLLLIPADPLALHVEVEMCLVG
jgi:uncharacterized protein YvpB